MTPQPPPPPGTSGPLSSVGLEPTTVSRAGSLMAAKLGLRWPDDRVEVVAAINDFRDKLYNEYPDLHLFDNVFHRIVVSSFPNIGGPCMGASCHQGFVLPDDVASVSAAWEHGDPLAVQSRWRESLYGIDSELGPRIAITETAEQVCTERPLRSTGGLKVFAESEDDAGKQVRIEAVLSDGTRKSLAFALIADGWAHISRPVRQILSVSLPEGCRGNITLAQEDGYELSRYGPHETVPLYRKFRVAQTCRTGVLLIQGAKKFVPVCHDGDVVEVGSRTVLQAAASFLKFRENTTDQKHLARANYDKAEMETALLGLHMRHRGSATQDGSPYAGAWRGASTPMPGYR